MKERTNSTTCSRPIVQELDKRMFCPFMNIFDIIVDSDMTNNKKRKVEFEVEALKFVGLNDGKRLFRVWWRGHQSTDVIPEENFSDTMINILRIVQGRGSAKKTKRYVLTGSASIVPSSKDVQRASVDDAVVQNQFRSVDQHCTLFAVLNMVPFVDSDKWLEAIML